MAEEPYISEIQVESNADLIRQLFSVFEAMADGVWVCDATPRLLWINRACEQLNDIRREDVCGKLVADLLEIGNFDKDVTTRVIDTGRPVAINQKVKSGRTLLVNGRPIFNDTGELAYVVGTERDLTELNLLKHSLDKEQASASQIKSELLRLKRKGGAASAIVADSDAMARVMETALRVADFDVSVLLTGPSGAGKSMIAKEIHDCSGRRDGPFLSLNCGSIPDSLIEAELYGYAPGAFTGAQKGGKIGLIEAADGGTLFLDEIDAFKPEMQVKLLTFLDTKSFIRVGDIKMRQVDVRLIAATNKDLEDRVAAGKFREDLWFRLNVVPITLPPISDRREDIPGLIRQHIATLNARYGSDRSVTPNAIELLCRYDFPGNVRELQNVLERSFVLSSETRIDVGDLPVEIQTLARTSPEIDYHTDLKTALQRVERDMLKAACMRHQTQCEIARTLGVSQPSIARLMKKHGIERSLFKDE